MALYFAYGSNLKQSWLCERIGAVRASGIAALPDQKLSFRKPGRDGSGKACFEPEPGQTLWGALYELGEAQLRALAAFEPSYLQCNLQLRQPDGGALCAISFRAQRFCDDLRPYHWYLELMIQGAGEHGLPRSWLEQLKQFDSQPDPHLIRD